MSGGYYFADEWETSYTDLGPDNEALEKFNHSLLGVITSEYGLEFAVISITNEIKVIEAAMQRLFIVDLQNQRGGIFTDSLTKEQYHTFLRNILTDNDDNRYEIMINENMHPIGLHPVVQKSASDMRDIIERVRNVNDPLSLILERAVKTEEVRADAKGMYHYSNMTTSRTQN